MKKSQLSQTTVTVAKQIVLVTIQTYWFRAENDVIDAKSILISRAMDAP